QKRFNHKVESRDITLENVKQSLVENTSDKEIDLIVGGFPCQWFSMSGYRVVSDKRNSLYLDMLDIIGKVKPKFIVMENVERLRSMIKGNVEKK
ncbi:MAG: DNA cytosine methyltransferase, partial [Bacilli bacterium]